MSELAAIVRCAAAARSAGRRFLLATVVGVHGSAYRRPGARMLVAEDGSVAGSISGGCLERDLVKRGYWYTRRDRAVVVRYDADGFGLGCDGVVDVFVERFDADVPAEPIETLARCLAADRTMRMATIIRSKRRDLPVGRRLVSGIEARVPEDALEDALASVDRPARWISAEGDVEALLEPIEPPPHLFVFGTNVDVVPLVMMARIVGFHVTVCDRQARFSTRAMLADADRLLVLPPVAVAAAVGACARPIAAVMSHEYEYDRDVVAALLRSCARYIGLLGPRRRAERIFDEIGLPPDTRVHAPIGLDLGAETPAEVALAIVAEAQAVLAGAPATFLRDRSGPIHPTRDSDERAVHPRRVSPALTDSACAALDTKVGAMARQRARQLTRPS